MKRGLVVLGRFVVAGVCYILCLQGLIYGMGIVAGHLMSMRRIVLRSLLTGGFGCVCTFVSLLLVWAVARWRLPEVMPRGVRWGLAALVALGLAALREAPVWMRHGMGVPVPGEFLFQASKFAEFVGPLAWILMALCLPSRGIEAQGRKA